jgi:hypothetical protein
MDLSNAMWSAAHIRRSDGAIRHVRLLRCGMAVLGG